MGWDVLERVRLKARVVNLLGYSVQFQGQGDFGGAISEYYCLELHLEELAGH